MNACNVAVLCVALVSLGCKREKTSGPPAEQADSVYDNRCATCHGNAGRGDGPSGAALVPHPRNFTDKAWQQSVTDAVIQTAILQGGMAVGKSPTMPANSDLSSRPAVLQALIAKIRGFAK